MLSANSDKEKRRQWDLLLKKYKLSVKDKRFIAGLNQLALWTDERKALTYPLHYQYDLALKEISRRLKIPRCLLKYLFTEELAALDKERQNLVLKAKERAGGGFVVESRNGILRILPRAEGQKFIRVLSGQKQTSTLKGQVASRGPKAVYRGQVKVLNSAKEGRKIKPGDFLVATMTSPDYILAMRRAAGFITDEGGVTCHAAIVGREMNKPVIIGTKIATQILKDGDKIEIDIEKGTVKKI